MSVTRVALRCGLYAVVNRIESYVPGTITSGMATNKNLLITYEWLPMCRDVFIKYSYVLDFGSYFPLIFQLISRLCIFRFLSKGRIHWRWRLTRKTPLN